jgi:hypothetical protein
LFLLESELFNAKVMIFWSVMQSLLEDSSVLDKKNVTIVGKGVVGCGY